MCQVYILYVYDTNNYVWVFNELPLWAKIAAVILIISGITEIVGLIIGLKRRVNKSADILITEKGLHISSKIFIHRFNWEEIGSVGLVETNNRFCKVQLKAPTDEGLASVLKFSIKRLFSIGAMTLDFLKYEESDRLKAELLKSNELYLKL